MSIGYEHVINLATAFGLEPEYTDNWGRAHSVCSETALKIIEAKGIHVDPVLVGQAAEVVVDSMDALPDRFSFHADTEEDSGDGSAQRIGDVHLRTVDERAQTRTFFFPAADVSLRKDPATGLKRLWAPFPRDLASGVYRIRASGSVGDKAIEASGWWVICPTKAYLPPQLEAGRRIAGVGVALYGIRSNRNWGVGDFSDLKRVVDWAKDNLGVDFIGLNPLHALFNRQPYHISPYLPSSRIFRNFIYLDIEAIEDFRDSPAAKSAVGNSETQRKLQDLRERDMVDYEGVSAIKLEVLRELFRTFMEKHGTLAEPDGRWSRFESFMNEEGMYLQRFATFCALDEHYRSLDPPCRSWREWPEALKDPSSEEVERFRIENREAVLFRMYIQWLVSEQLSEVQRYAEEKGMLIGLFHDLALGVDPDGADFWALQEFFHHGFKIGAPPDAFAPDGQDWGFAPPNRETVRNSGYEPFLVNLRSNCKYGGALRIDHVMQLHRLFWIPEGKKPRDGVYVRDHEHDLLAVTALAGRESRTVIIGEDLGTVPFDLKQRLMDKGIFSYRVFYFERDSGNNQLQHFTYPQDALVSISTHDLPTLAGFWSGQDIDLRRNIGQLEGEREELFREERTQHKAKIMERLVQDGFLPAHRAHEAWLNPQPTDELHTAVLDFVFQTPSRMVLVSQEDVFLDTRQQNLPGTTSERPNWVTKMLYTVEELTTHPEAVRLTMRVRSLLEKSGRCSF